MVVFVITPVVLGDERIIAQTLVLGSKARLQMHRNYVSATDVGHTLIHGKDSESEANKWRVQPARS